MFFVVCAGNTVSPKQWLARFSAKADHGEVAIREAQTGIAGGGKAK
jgi:hypothetical protein